MNDFNNCVRNVDLVEHPYSRSLYTWFTSIVSECWEQEVIGHGLFAFHSKMKNVRGALKCLRSRVKEKQIELDEVNCKIYGGCIEPSILAKASNLNIEYKQLCDAERQLYKSKARMQWYKDADASASYFHKNMSMHQASNRITHMHNSEGALVENYDDVLKRSINADFKTMLCRTVTTDEIEGVVLNIKKGKAPRPNGFS
ncbi:hypothetical protein LIER_26109 [Lithospermum erythrorhizon]|uniref:RNA-directed DNA polymerase, eukaryota, reverse transcriptase zinc-binding domain protein n=1 Tax=Lithospermum erythrorhizon TaxID=34254 RepID=A0AAV3R8I2_LITER